MMVSVRLRPALLVSALTLLTCAGLVSAVEQGTTTADTVESRFPGLSSGPLRLAVVSTLPIGVVLTVDALSITRKEITAEIAKVKPPIRQQLSEYGFFMLEQMAARRLLAKEAEGWASRNNVSGDTSGEKLIGKYLGAVASGVVVTDDEVAQFFKENSGMFGSAALDQVKADLKAYLESEKREAAIRDHIDSVSSRHAVKVSGAWASQQYQRWIKNPVEQARRSKKPTLVDFGADGCRPCEMMTPIIEKLRKEYEGKLNVVFVHVRKGPILGAHYGISAIPVQAFFDKSGKEVFRHVGFLDKKSIENKLKELGMK